MPFSPEQPFDADDKQVATTETYPVPFTDTFYVSPAMENHRSEEQHKNNALGLASRGIDNLHDIGSNLLDVPGKVLETAKKMTVGGLTILSAIAIGGVLQERQQFSVDTSLAVNAARNIKGFDQLNTPFLPIIWDSPKTDPRTIQVKLENGRDCTIPYETYKTSKFNFEDNKARLISHGKTVDTGTCPTILKKKR